MRQTQTVHIGSVQIGGGAPIAVQSMTTTDTADAVATLAQIQALSDAGCELIRVAVPHVQAVEALPIICRQSPIPVIADIHFDARLAVLSLEAGVAGLRINPGNIGGTDKVNRVIDAAQQHNACIRIGVNAGSLEKDLLHKHKGPSPEAMVESALRHISMLEKRGFSHIKVSLKSSSVPTTIAAYTQLAKQCSYPLHIGITEAGTLLHGTIKSSVGIGILLYQGLGDTLRVSLTHDPVQEVQVAWKILQALGLRSRGPEVISCPTCGRTQIDLIGLAQAVEEQLVSVKESFTVAVMGCVVNGPGEAKEADVGIAGGHNKGIVFRKGTIVRSVSGGQAALLAALMEEVQHIIQEKQQQT